MRTEKEEVRMIQPKITRRFRDLVQQEKWSPGKGEAGKANQDPKMALLDPSKTPGSGFEQDDVP